MKEYQLFMCLIPESFLYAIFLSMVILLAIKVSTMDYFISHVKTYVKTKYYDIKPSTDMLVSLCVFVFKQMPRVRYSFNCCFSESKFIEEIKIFSK